MIDIHTSHLTSSQRPNSLAWLCKIKSKSTISSTETWLHPFHWSQSQRWHLPWRCCPRRQFDCYNLCILIQWLSFASSFTGSRIIIHEWFIRIARTDPEKLKLYRINDSATMSWSVEQTNNRTGDELSGFLWNHQHHRLLWDVSTKTPQVAAGARTTNLQGKSNMSVGTFYQMKEAGFWTQTRIWTQSQ